MSEFCDFNRRKALTNFAVGAAAMVAGGTVSSTATADTASRLLTVGDGGEFPTIQDALAVAAAGATATSPFSVFVLPGVYDLRTLGSSLTLPPWVTLVGTHRKAVEIWLADDVFLAFTNNAAISEITFRYRGNKAALIGNPSGFQQCDQLREERELDRRWKSPSFWLLHAGGVGRRSRYTGHRRHHRRRAI